MIARSVGIWLRGNAAITALTSTIEPVKLQANRGDPALVYWMDNDQRIRLIDNSSTLKRCDVSIDTYSTRYDSTRQLANTVHEQLHNYAGPMGAHVSERCDCERMTDLYEDPTKLYRVNMTFELWYIDAAGG